MRQLTSSRATPHLHARVAALAAGLLLLCQQALAATGLYYTSSAQSWVGQGETVWVTPAGGFLFDVSRNFDDGISFDINDFASNPNFQSERWWFLDFAAPFNATLTVETYAAATRWPFQETTVPGLNFSGNGRGNNTLTGSFEVLAVAYGAGGAVTSFAADFIQYDEGFPDRWSVGSIRFNSEVPILAIPDIGTAGQFGLGLMVLAFLVRRRKDPGLIAQPEAPRAVLGEA